MVVDVGGPRRRDTKEVTRMNTVSELLATKGQAVWSVAPATAVFEALQLMAEKNIGAVVVQEGETLVGILSERDYARKVILQGRTSRDTPVREIMTAKERYLCGPRRGPRVVHGNHDQAAHSSLTDRRGWARGWGDIARRCGRGDPVES